MKLQVLLISSIILASLFLQASCQSERAIQRFLRLLENTNLTDVYTKILPTPSTYPSVLDYKQNESLQSWENWRIGRSRMRSKAEIPKYYAPEVEEYPTSIYWSSTGLGYVITGAVFYLIFIAFVIARFLLGFLGAKYERKRKLERCVKHTPTVAYGVGLALLLSGIVTQMVGTLHFNHLINEASEDAISQANVMYNDTTLSFDTLKGTSAAGINYTTSSNSTNQTWRSSVDLNEETIVLKGISNLQNTTKAFSNELKSSKSAVSGALWVFFTVSLILMGPAGFVYAKKIAKPAIWFGVFALFMLGLPWIFAASYYKNQLYLADLCQQVNITLYFDPPVYGTGLSYYINCLSSPEKQSLINAEFEVQDDLVEALDIWRFYANKTSGANTTLINEIGSIPEATQLTLTDPYISNANLIAWTDKILKPTYNSLKTMVDVRDCKYNLKWAQKAQTDLCYKGLYYNTVGLSGDIVVFFGFLFTAIGLILAKNVFERMKEQQDTMVSRADLNLEI